MAEEPKTPSVRVMTRQDVAEVVAFLNSLDALLSDTPVWVSHAEITLAKAGQCGPEDDLGTVQVVVDYDTEEQRVFFKPTGF
jgi:hypothetical protein